MDLASRLLLFIEVVELGSFAKVSEHRNIDRSVVSKQISKLEDELGVRLLNRTTRSLSLTSAGKDMVKKASALREILSEAHKISQNYHSTPRGSLKISSTTFLGRHYIHPALINFQKEYPDIEVELRVEDRIVDIVGEGYDIGFRIGTPRDSSLIATKIAENKLLFVASPSFLKKHGNPNNVEDLESLPAIVYSATGYLADKIKYYKDDQAKFVKLNPVHKVNEDRMMVRAAVAGIGIAAVLTYMITDELETGALVPIMPDLELGDPGALYAVYPHRDAPIKTQLFIDTVKAFIGNDVPVWDLTKKSRT